MVAAPAFVGACNRNLPALEGAQLSSKDISSMACHLTEGSGPEEKQGPRRFRIVDKHGLGRPTEARVDAFAESLRNAGINVTVRRQRGADRSAACGQLRLQTIR